MLKTEANIYGDCESLRKMKKYDYFIILPDDGFKKKWDIFITL